MSPWLTIAIDDQLCCPHPHHSTNPTRTALLTPWVDLPREQVGKWEKSLDSRALAKKMEVEQRMVKLQASLLVPLCELHTDEAEARCVCRGSRSARINDKELPSK